MPTFATGSQEAQGVENRARADDEGHEPHVAAERSQERREAPEPGVAPAAVVALFVVDPYEHAARGTYDGAGCLALEHGLDGSIRLRLT